MTLPPLSSTKPSQSSITTFFQPRQPKYAPPPSQRPASPDPTPEAQLLAESESRSHKNHIGTSPTSTPAGAPTDSTASATPPLLFTPPSTSPNLPREATIRPLNSADIPALKRINSLLLPVAYPEAFYAAALASPFSRVITWTDPSSPKTANIVGAVVCRLEPLSDAGTHALYIQSLALLSPYRAYGLATAALADLIALAALSKSLRVAHVSAHVWTNNEDGLRWYTSRGFARDALPIPGYYLKLRPNTAYLVRRDLSPLPILPPGGTQRTSMGNAQSAPPVLSPTAAAANLPPMSAPSNAPAPAGPARTPSSQSLRPGQSFQNKRADTEWNDLPTEMMGAAGSSASSLAPPGSGTVSEASSRSSSTVRKKKERKYAAAAFGS